MPVTLVMISGYGFRIPVICKWHGDCFVTLASKPSQPRGKATNPNQMRWQMEALILIAIFLSFGNPDGGKAGW